MPPSTLTALAVLTRRGDYPALERRIARLSPRRRAEPALALQIAEAYLGQGQVFLARGDLVQGRVTLTGEVERPGLRSAFDRLRRWLYLGTSPQAPYLPLQLQIPARP